MKFAKITSPHEYCGGYKIVGIDAHYYALVEALGKPFKNGEPDYPDDDCKTDVCWGIVGEDGSKLAIWNYKNGPSYCGNSICLRDIDYFSVWYDNDDLFDTIVRAISDVRGFIIAPEGYVYNEGQVHKEEED